MTGFVPAQSETPAGVEPESTVLQTVSRPSGSSVWLEKMKNNALARN